MISIIVAQVLALSTSACVEGTRGEVLASRMFQRVEGVRVSRVWPVRVR